ncbi:nickel ABC transporter substrate-binding protein [Paenibacillus algorifonticola]|uniref:nickel ABC transporter substrate-binding protein n=1 Tax=Paenibacillus algorifonticola TaxID=684063 RepID=UPI003D2AAF94
MRKIIPFILFIGLLLLAAACSKGASTNGEQAQPPEKELSFLFNFASQTIDPHLDYTPLRAGVVETLVKLGEDLQIQPWLAEEWSSPDGQHWTFKIREQVTFQNGKELDADAVKQSLERAMEQNPGVKQVLKIKQMEASGQSLQITTEQPFPQFPSELVHPNTAIIDVSAAEPDKKPIGTGPFQVASFTSGSSLKLDRYDKYWNGAAKLSHATFSFNEDANARLSALLAGDADIVYRPPVESLETMKSNASLHLDSVVSLRTHELIFNTEHEEFQNSNVRKAFDALVNRDELKDAIMGGQATVASGPFLPEFPFVPDYESKETGLDAARKWFQQAGYEVEQGKVTKNGKPLSFKLVTYASRAEFPLLAQVLQSQAKELGITITIAQVDKYEDYLLEKGDWDLGTYSPLIAPRGDASYFLNVAFKPEGSLNFGKIDDKELSAWIDELDQTVDTNERYAFIKKALTRINEEMYYSYLVHPNTLVVYQGKVKNWVTSKSEYYMLTNELDVEVK